MSQAIEATTDSTDYADLAQTGTAPPLPAAGESPLPPVPPLEFVPPDTDGEAPGDVEPHLAPGGVNPGIPSGLGLRKFRDTLSVPPTLRITHPRAITTVRAQRIQRRLHADLPATTMWAYNGSVPGPTIEVDRGVRARIDWENALGENDSAVHLPYDVVRVAAPPRLDARGAPVPDGRAVAAFGEALRPGGRSTSHGPGPDAHPPLAHTEELTAATVVHLHGALTDGHNDGWAHNVTAYGGTARTEYPNDQEAATLWYHDHAMAVTRFNVPTGLAGFYLIRDDNERRLRLPSGRFEIPLMIADRNLETAPPTASGAPGAFTGRLLYKQAGFTLTQEQYDAGVVGEIPVTGPFTTVNGTIWPQLRVEPRWYRFRILNASSSRVLQLAVHDTTDENVDPAESIPSTIPDPTNPAGQIPNPAFVARRVSGLLVIGTDGGLLPRPVPAVGDTLVLGPAERADVLVDFAGFSGRTIELRNEVGTAINAQPTQADATIMRFVVDRARPPSHWSPPSVTNPAWVQYRHLENGDLQIGDQIIDEHEHVWVGLVPPGVRGSLHPEMWELTEISESEAAELPPAGAGSALKRDLIRLTNANGSVTYLTPIAKLFDDTTATVLARGAWAVWNIVHLGGPSHPMHIHMTTFQMLARRSLALQSDGVALFDPASGSTVQPLPVPGPGPVIDPIQAGTKDTYLVGPGEWVSLLGHFDGAAGSFMYHCHILDHEDHTMMRPFVVLPPDLLAFHAGHGGGHSGHGG